MEELVSNADNYLVLNAGDNKAFQTVRYTLIDVMKSLKEIIPASQLWIQCFQMTTLIELYVYIIAELTVHRREVSLRPWASSFLSRGCLMLKADDAWLVTLVMDNLNG